MGLSGIRAKVLPNRRSASSDLYHFSGGIWVQLFYRRHAAELQHVVIRIFEEDLLGAIGAVVEQDDLCIVLLEVAMPGIEIIDLHGKVAALGIFVHRSVEAFEQVQFTRFAESKPGTVEVKGRAWFLLQTDDGFVKLNAAWNVADAQGDMIEIENFHRWMDAFG